MATIPAVRQTGGDCITVAGLTVCPHLVYLKKKQQKTVQKLHRQNVSEMRKLSAKAKKTAQKSVKKSPKKKKAART